MCANPSSAIRALISAMPRRPIQALVAVLSEGPIMSVARSFQVGFSPGSSSRSGPDASALFCSEQRPAFGEIDSAVADCRHRLREHGDLDDRGGLELGAAVVRVGAPALEVTRRDAHPALAPLRGPPHGRVERRLGGARARARREKRDARGEREGPFQSKIQNPKSKIETHPPYASTRIPLSMRRTSPASTLPGPISRARSTPSRARR